MGWDSVASALQGGVDETVGERCDAYRAWPREGRAAGCFPPVPRALSPGLEHPVSCATRVHEAGPAGDDSHRPHAGFTCGARPRLGRDECLTGHLWASGLSASPATLPVPHERFPLSLEAPTGLEVRAVGCDTGWDGSRGQRPDVQPWLLLPVSTRAPSESHGLAEPQSRVSHGRRSSPRKAAVAPVSQDSSQAGAGRCPRSSLWGHWRLLGLP